MARRKRCLEDHPRTRKWLITMVRKSPNWGYSPSKWLKFAKWRGCETPYLEFPAVATLNSIYFQVALSKNGTNSYVFLRENMSFAMGFQLPLS